MKRKAKVLAPDPCRGVVKRETMSLRQPQTTVKLPPAQRDTSKGSDGGGPFMAGLIADKTGALYGTTASGGEGSNIDNVCFGKGSNGVVF